MLGTIKNGLMLAGGAAVAAGAVGGPLNPAGVPEGHLVAAGALIGTAGLALHVLMKD